MALFIKKTADKMGTLPVTGGAIRHDQATVTANDGGSRKYNLATQLPGLVAEELQTGEEPVLLGGQGTDVNFGVFEEAIIQSIAWANEIPPEILRLAFSNNYSASQAAINEFKIYLNMRWSIEGETFAGLIYQEWLLSETLQQNISAPGLLQAWRNPQRYDIFGAWVAADWYGSIKPSTDMLKQAKGSKLLVNEGWSTNAREARITTGTKFSKNIKRLTRENKQKADAARPLLELKAEFGEDQTAETLTALDDAVVQLVEVAENG
jgi:capsid protein